MVSCVVQLYPGLYTILMFLPASWDLDTGSDRGKVQFNEERIEGSVFFDIDNVSDKCSSLDHMLPSPQVFQEHVGKVK